MGDAVVGGRGAWTLAAAALSAAALAAACAGRSAAPTPGAPTRAARADEACGACHAEIAEEWRGSLHRRAFTDAPFARAYARESRAFCKNCHAPEGDVEVGVSCASCHAPDARAASRPGGVHAPMRAAPGPSGACARCHEFAFDGRRDDAALMQSTVGEHAASPFRDTRCDACHMPRVGEHRSHRFGTSQDAAALGAALSVDAQRVDGSAVVLELRAIGVGHAYPTGDLFRRLQISVETDDDGAPSRPPIVATRLLARRFATERAASGVVVVVETSDDRLRPDRPTEVRLDLGEAARGRPLRWKVEYHRAEVADDDPPPSARVLLREGRL